MDKEVHLHNGIFSSIQFSRSVVYYSAIKRNAFESVLIGWMNLEPIIQNEVSQKEKDKYHILCIYTESRKMVLKEFIYRAAMEKQT